MKRTLPLLLTSVVLISGCTTLNLPSTNNQHFNKLSWNQRAKKLRSITRWDIDGAFSVSENNKTNLASYTWRQNNNRYQIAISSSLNLYSVKIYGKPGKVRLQEAQKKAISARSPEILMQKRLGFSLPLSDLSYWIRGLPAPGSNKKSFDRYGHLSHLQQQGWSVQFSNYVQLAKADVPRTLKISGRGIKIKIVVKHWGE